MNPPVLIVTGGGRGIGACTARLAAARGYAVCVNYLRNQAAAAGVVAGIQRQGGTAIAAQADVGVEAEVVALFARVEQELGRPAALVNNAARLELQLRVESMDAARLQRMFATNVIGGAGGSNVNVSSGAARYGLPGEYVDYAATKGALETFTLGLARAKRVSRERSAAGPHLHGVAWRWRRVRSRGPREEPGADATRRPARRSGDVAGGR